MSTIPLSSVDPDPRSAADRVSDYNNSPPPASEHNAALDKHVSAAVDKLFAAEEAAAAAPMKDLNSLISENLDKHYEAVEDAESFTLSREARDTLAHRYGNQHSLKDTIHAYLGWGKKFREDPQAAGLEFAESYARATPYAKREYKPAKTEVYVDEGGKRYTGAKLSAIIDDAMETSSAEKAAYEATPEERKALKALFPGKKDFREIMETIVKIEFRRFRSAPRNGSPARSGLRFSLNSETAGSTSRPAKCRRPYRARLSIFTRHGQSATQSKNGGCHSVPGVRAVRRR